MDIMIKDRKDIKDSERDSQKDTLSIPAPYESGGFRSGFYRKTNKLVTALYMVTDVIDKEEPLRNKLRTLGLEILSDTPTTKEGPSLRPPLCFFDISFAGGS